ncbi:MAG TPA: hypothetical protein VMS75_03555 [Terriglobales bacterium]|nr:hypothetical protein [Terriglobales bacterium]
MKGMIRAILVLGLVWVLAGAPEALVAARRQGAQLRVTLTSKEVVDGELIGVRGKTIILLTKQGDRSVILGEVATVFVKDATGTIVGGVAGMTAGVIVDASMWRSFKRDTSDAGEVVRALFTPGAYLVMGLVLAGGGVAGMLIGHTVHKGRTYNVEEMTQEQERGFIESLRKKAVVPDYK